MKVCDRHPTEKAADTMSLEHESTHVDLCAACVALVRDFIGVPESKTVDPVPPKRGLLDKFRKN